MQETVLKQSSHQICVLLERVFNSKHLTRKCTTPTQFTAAVLLLCCKSRFHLCETLLHQMLLVAANSASVCYSSSSLLGFRIIPKYLLELTNCNTLKFLVTYAAAEHHQYSNSMSKADAWAHLLGYWKRLKGLIKVANPSEEHS